MSIGVTETVTDSAQRVLTGSGVLALVVLVPLRYASQLVSVSYVPDLARFARDAAGEIAGNGAAGLFERGYTLFVGSLTSPADPLPAVALPLMVAVVLALPLLAELVFVLAVRALARDERRGVPVKPLGGDLPATLARSFLANSMAIAAVSVGTLLVVPGIVLSVLFTFVRQAVVLGGRSVTGALRESVELVVGNPLAVLLLVAVLAALFVAATELGTLLPVGPASVVPGAAARTVELAVLTSAYLQATGDG